MTRRKNCSEECPRYSESIRNPRMRGFGQKDAKIVLVGDFPGQMEDSRGASFVGASGRLLDATLSRVGMSRSDVYITNAVKCATSMENRKPKDKDIECCSRYLKKELAVIQPNVVGALGNTALKALLNREGIAQIKNNVFFSKEYQVKVIPIFHPSYVLKNLSATEDFTVGFQLLVKESASKDIS